MEFTKADGAGYQATINGHYYEVFNVGTGKHPWRAVRNVDMSTHTITPPGGKNGFANRKLAEASCVEDAELRSAAAEDAHDAAVARKALNEIKVDPTRLVGGAELAERLEAMDAAEAAPKKTRKKYAARPEGLPSDKAVAAALDGTMSYASLTDDELRDAYLQAFGKATDSTNRRYLETRIKDKVAGKVRPRPERKTTERLHPTRRVDPADLRGIPLRFERTAIAAMDEAIKRHGYTKRITFIRQAFAGALRQLGEEAAAIAMEQSATSVGGGASEEART